MKPQWRSESYRVRDDDDVPTLVRALWWLTPIATTLRVFTDDHHSALQHFEMRTRVALSPGSYHPTKFRMQKIALYEGPPEGVLYPIKEALSKDFSVVASVRTHLKSGISVWSHSLLEKDHTTLTVPAEEMYSKKGHAIFICGYDDDQAAFRIKNSWGTSWGDKGFAWLPYDYRVKHGNAAYNISVAYTVLKR